ncbi:SIP domain-containing protein [Microbacterium sp. NPDC057944]|uniref:SIP domain-containing protein n=1 Tax=Microbacterium sp. NPDC057944 TaxID=3346286 RepID=UPI0036DC8A23
MSHRRFTPHPLVLRRVTVLRAVDVTPRMRRVTLGGDELGAFTRDGFSLPAFASPVFDDHVKVMFASEGPIEAVLPVQLAHGIDWPPSETRLGRDYTPRRVAEGELDLDFVLHADGGEQSGPAEEWARRATEGDELWIVGPKSSTILPAEADRIVLIGDETALPAIGRFFEERPIAGPVHAVITIADPSARQDLSSRPEDDVRWIVAAPGDGAALEDAVRTLDPAVFSGTPYVWAAAESRALLPVRRLLTAHGVPRSHTDVTGYWHARSVEETTAPDDARAAAVPPPLPSPVGWFAVRAALQTGVFDSIDDAGSTAADLEQRLGFGAGTAAPLLSVLADHGLLLRDDDRFRITEAGAELVADEHERERFDGLEADQVLALADLAPALRTGSTAWEHRNGRTFATDAESDGEVGAELAEHAEGLAYLMPALLAVQPWDEGALLSPQGPGADVVRDALVPGSVAGRWTITDVAGPSVVAIHAHALAHRTDAEAHRYLAALAETAEAVLLLEATNVDALNPSVSEDELVRVGVTGTGLRSADRLGEIAASAGWERTDVQELGWGVSCLTLRPRTMAVLPESGEHAAP